MAENIEASIVYSSYDVLNFEIVKHSCSSLPSGSNNGEAATMVVLRRSVKPFLSGKHWVFDSPPLHHYGNRVFLKWSYSLIGKMVACHAIVRGSYPRRTAKGDIV